jgi:hypothetical protein
MSSSRLTRRDGTHSERTARLPREDDRQLDLSDLLTNALLRRVNDEAERADRRAAEDWWDQGTLLNEAAAMVGLAERVSARFVDGPEAALERMRVAKVTTRWLAGVYGLRRLRLGLRLLDLLHLGSLVELESVDLPALGPDGEPARFPATAGALEAAVRALESGHEVRRAG